MIDPDLVGHKAKNQSSHLSSPLHMLFGLRLRAQTFIQVNCYGMSVFLWFNCTPKIGRLVIKPPLSMLETSWNM
jgi:hypothetical protein